MAANCPSCGQTLPLDGPLTAAEVEDAIRLVVPTGDASWFWGHNLKNSTLSLRGEALKPLIVSQQLPDGNELNQGDTTEIYIVFQIQDQFFRKTGYGDSYGEAVWDGPLRRVEPKTKTVLVYE